jgi:hypothetical protein
MRAAGAVFALASAAGVALSIVVARGGRPLPLLLGAWGGAWLVAVAAAHRMTGRRAIVLILVAGAALRLASLAGPPATSDDLYRYAWDGRVQAVGVDPYDQPPASAQLAQLREGWLWPAASVCVAHGVAPGCTRINRPPARTIYPPVAEVWFAAVYRAAGVAARHKAWQVAGLVTELATLGLLVAALARWGRDQRWAALYALSPAPALEIVNNGHVDGLATMLVMAALVVMAPGETPATRWREAAAAALITAAALVKLYPAILLLPLVACRSGFRVGALVRTAAIAAGLGALAYAPHVAAVGSRVLGYLPGYLREENYRSGGRFLIAHVLHVPHVAVVTVTVLGVVAVAVWVVIRRPSLPAASAAVIGALLLAASPAQPWYAVSLLALAAVARRPAWAAVVVAGYGAALSSVLAPAHAVTIGGWAYTAALVVVVAAAGRRVRDAR